MPIDDEGHEPQGRAAPHNWPADRPLPEEGDFYWVRFNMIAPRPNGGVPVPLHEHWEPVVVTWCAALVPTQCYVKRIGDYPMLDPGAVGEWGPRCAFPPPVRSDLPTEPGTYWTHTGYEHDDWEAHELWNVTETDVLARTCKVLGLCVRYGDEVNHTMVPVAKSDVRWWCGPLTPPPQPPARAIKYASEVEP